MENWKPKSKTPDEALELLKRQCSLREFCQSDIRNKLYKWAVSPTDQDAIIADLINDGFLNEERYASAFVHDKATIQGWGEVKIRAALKQKGISDFSINKGLNRDDISFEDILGEQYERYYRRYKSLSLKKRNAKIAERLIQRGFSSSLIWKLIKERG